MGCRRVASRHDVGGGVAMAATGLLSIGLWFGGIWLLRTIGIATSTAGFVFGVGLLAVPVALPTAFLAGTVLWRNLDPTEASRRDGALFGGIAACCSLIAGALAPVVVVGVSNIARGEMTVIEAAVFTALLTPTSVLFAGIAAGWLVVPLGAFGGWYHERSKAAG